VDPAKGDVYVTDGLRNRRVVVFDAAETSFAMGTARPRRQKLTRGRAGCFRRSGCTHCHGKRWLVYVCDRWGDRVEVFDKMAISKRTSFLESKALRLQGWVQIGLAFYRIKLKNSCTLSSMGRRD